MKPLVLGTVLSVLGFTSAFAQTAIPGTIDVTLDGAAIVTSPGALSYQIDVAEAGDYYLELKYSSDLAKGVTAESALVVNVDGTPVISAADGFNLLSTIVGNLTTTQFLWAGLMEGVGLTSIVKTIPLAAGVQTLSLDVTTGGWELEAIRLIKEQVPFNGTPLEVGPGATVVIEAEDYDEGPQGLSYSDTGWGNDFGFYNRGDGVDIGEGRDDNAEVSGFVIGNVVVGEWTEYTIDVAQAGNYQLEVRYATGAPAGGGIKVAVDGDDLATISLPKTTNWNTFGIATEVVSLKTGVQVIRVTATGRQNLDYLALTKETTTLSNEVLKAHEVVVYPNPSATGIFNLGQVQDYVVYSTTGAEILSGKGANINLSAFPQGLYLLKVADKTFKLLYN